MIIEIKERRTLSTRNSKGRMIFLTFGVNEISRQDFDRMVSAQGVAKKMLEAGTLVIVQDDNEPVSRETISTVVEPAVDTEPTQSPKEIKADPPKPPINSVKSIADMDVKAAVLLVRATNEIQALEKLFEIEKRETILKAISNKIDDLKAK